MSSVSLYFLTSIQSGLRIKSAAAIKKGLSEEGGLFVPEEIPNLTLIDLEKMIKLSYTERAVYILKQYLTDFLVKELRECARNAYNGKFSSKSPNSSHAW